MEETFAFAVTYFYKYFLAYTSSELKKLGLSYGQLPFILYIGKHPDCTQAELTNHLRIDWGHCQRSVTRLVDGNFIQKAYLPGDSRSYHLKLTEAGRHAFAASHQMFADWDNGRMAKLTEQEKTELMQLLHKLMDAEEASRNHGKV